MNYPFHIPLSLYPRLTYEGLNNRIMSRNVFGFSHIRFFSLLLTSFPLLFFDTFATPHNTRPIPVCIYIRNGETIDKWQTCREHINVLNTKMILSDIPLSIVDDIEGVCVLFRFGFFRLWNWIRIFQSIQSVQKCSDCACVIARRKCRIVKSEKMWSQVCKIKIKRRLLLSITAPW